MPESQSTNYFDEILKNINELANITQNLVSENILPYVEQGTATIGYIVTPIAENPFVQFITKQPGLSWLMAALGQVDTEKIEKEVKELKAKYPLESPNELAHRAMLETVTQAARIGVLTNFIPPLAITLLALDIAAINALQAELIYRIAVIYGFSPDEPDRRGEVIAIWGLFTTNSGLLKTGLSIVEIIPGIGLFLGVTTNAMIVYLLGHFACLFYETKLNKNTL